MALQNSSSAQSVFETQSQTPMADGLTPGKFSKTSHVVPSHKHTGGSNPVVSSRVGTGSQTPSPSHAHAGSVGSIPGNELGPEAQYSPSRHSWFDEHAPSRPPTPAPPPAAPRPPPPAFPPPPPGSVPEEPHPLKTRTELSRIRLAIFRDTSRRLPEFRVVLKGSHHAIQAECLLKRCKPKG